MLCRLGLGDIGEGAEQGHAATPPSEPAQQRRTLQSRAERRADDGEPPGVLRLRCWGRVSWLSRTGLQAHQGVGMGRGHLLELRHVQTGQAADGVAEVGQLLDQGEPPHIVGRVQALATGGELGLGQRVAALPDAQGGHRHPQHARDGAAAMGCGRRITGGRRHHRGGRPGFLHRSPG